MDEITLDDIIEVLEDVREDIDYEQEKKLIDDGILDSFDILSIISALNEEFDITIPAKDIVPENFNSAEAMLAMVQRLVEEVINHLSALDGSRVEVKLDVTVTAPDGVPQNTVRTVSENCKVLKIKDFGFEE